MEDSRQPTKLHALATAMVKKLQEEGHKHPRWNGGFDVIGSKECFVCLPVIKLAEAAQHEASLITMVNYKYPKIQPCEICGEEHKNYECCEDCNLDTHNCNFCGHRLGHSEVSACYIEDAKAKES